MVNRLLAILTAAAWLSGCGGEAYQSSGQSEQSRGRAEQALSYYISPYSFVVPSYQLYSWDLYGYGLNGTGLNGSSLDGHLVVAVALSGVQLNGPQQHTLNLTGTLFRGAISKGANLGGRAMVGATFQAQLENGDALALRIDDADTSTDPTMPDVVRYAVSYATQTGWSPLCGLDPSGAPVRAIPLEGTWDYRKGVPGGGNWNAQPGAFTFACEGFVLAKCVALGYAPWRVGRLCSAPNGCVSFSLREHHQACTRMARADYCGNGEPFTADGVHVNVYDGIGLRTDSEAWSFEAEWGPGGARCASQLRQPSGAVPACWSSLASAACGQQGFGSGALLMSETP